MFGILVITDSLGNTSEIVLDEKRTIVDIDGEPVTVDVLNGGILAFATNGGADLHDYLGTAAPGKARPLLDRTIVFWPAYMDGEEDDFVHGEGDGVGW